MEFFKAGMILKPDQGGVTVPIGIGKHGDPPSFTVGMGNEGGCIVGVRAWDEKKGQACLDAGISLMNMRADDKVTPKEAVDLVVKLFPSAEAYHLTELEQILEKVQSSKAPGSDGGTSLTAAEAIGIAMILAPAVTQEVGKTNVGKSIQDKIAGLFGSIFGKKA